MGYSKEVRNYARNLYLQITETGEKKYSLEDIATEVCRKFANRKYSVSRETVRLWAENEEWDNLLRKIYEKSIVASREQLEKEEFAVIDEKTKIFTEIIKYNYGIFKASANVMGKRMQDLLKACETAEGREEHIKEVMVLNQMSVNILTRFIEAPLKMEDTNDNRKDLSLTQIRNSWERITNFSTLPEKT